MAATGRRQAPASQASETQSAVSASPLFRKDAHSAEVGGGGNPGQLDSRRLSQEVSLDTTSSSVALQPMHSTATRSSLEEEASAPVRAVAPARGNGAFDIADQPLLHPLVRFAICVPVFRTAQL